MTEQTQTSSSQGPKTLISREPFPEPIHAYLSRAVAGHQEIVAAIVNHAETDAERQLQIGQLAGDAPV